MSHGHRPYEPIDWQRVVLALRARLHGCGFQRQYRSLGIDERTINRLARGEVREPRYTAGVRLLKLYEQTVSDEPTSLV